MTPTAEQTAIIEAAEADGLEVSNIAGGKKYFKYSCQRCGERASNTYSEPYYSDMLRLRLCWTCNYWRAFEEKRFAGRDQMTIIEGHVYSPGNRTTGSFRGMAGRRFDIEYINDSAFAGKRITTFDLWSGSTLPDELRAKFPDTARFLGGAERVNASGITCWNPSDTQSEPYPLPRTIGINQ